MYGKKSNFSESGLINYDDVIINDSLIKKLQNRFTSKIALVTGRGKESVNYSLKNMLKIFDLKNSVFLEDESRSMAKPNPESLIRCISGMNSKITLYVGDSMEDFIMAKKATILGSETIFCGIIGTSKNPEKKLKLFQNNGAVLILDSINLIPKILNLE
jgi:phosphoglycolate phosphatase-like HAD superfamily hydrolase